MTSSKKELDRLAGPSIVIPGPYGQNANAMEEFGFQECPVRPSGIHCGRKMTLGTRRGRHRRTLAWRERTKRIRPSPLATSSIRFRAWRAATECRVGRPPSVTGWRRNPFFSLHPILARLPLTVMHQTFLKLKRYSRSQDTGDSSVQYKNKFLEL